MTDVAEGCWEVGDYHLPHPSCLLGGHSCGLLSLVQFVFLTLHFLRQCCYICYCVSQLSVPSHAPTPAHPLPLPLLISARAKFLPSLPRPLCLCMTRWRRDSEPPCPLLSALHPELKLTALMIWTQPDARLVPKPTRQDLNPAKSQFGT